MPELSPSSINGVNGKVLVSFRRTKGFHTVLAFPGICCFTDQCIAESSVVQKKAENMFSLSLPWLFLVRTREKSRRLKQNKREQGRMVFVYFGAEWAAVRCSLFCSSCGTLCETERSPFPSRALRLLPLLWEGLCPGQGMPSFPRNRPKLLYWVVTGNGDCLRLVQQPKSTSLSTALPDSLLPEQWAIPPSFGSPIS